MKIVSLFAWLLVSSLATPASASSLISCVKAARSSNEGAFVIFDEQLGPIKDRSPAEHRVLRMTYEIFPLQGQEFNYPENKLTVPMTFWEDSTASWEVVFEPNDGRPLPACPIPIVSNDAEYLILLAQEQGTAPDSIAMQIYKRPSQTQLGTEWPPRGNLVRTLTLKELWPGYKFPHGDLLITGGTPLWFAGATFDFGKTYHSLVHKTPWGDIFHIDLNTGSVSRDTKQPLPAEAVSPSDESRDRRE